MSLNFNKNEQLQLQTDSANKYLTKITNEKEEEEEETEAELTTTKTLLESTNNSNIKYNEDLTNEMNDDQLEDDENDDDDDYYEDDDQNNNYMCESDEYEDEEHDENNIYLNDPENFEYELFPLTKLDWIVEKKCEKVCTHLGLNDPLDSIYILKQFTWNLQKLIEAYDKDKQTFLKTYFSDNNNNNSRTIPVNLHDKSKFTSYINIFTTSENSFFKNVNINSTSANLSTLVNSNLSTALQSKVKLASFCNICCNVRDNPEKEMLALNECCSNGTSESHYFCIDCWHMHFEYNIQMGVSSSFECMQTKCKKIATKEFVLNCLLNSANTTTSKDTLERYKRLLAIDLIKESEDLQMCPGEIYLSSGSSARPTSSVSFSLSSTPTTSSSVLMNMTATPKSAPAVTSFKLNSNLKSTPTTTLASSTHTSQVSLNESSSTSLISYETKKCNYIVWIKSKPASRRVLCTLCQTQYCFMCLMPYHAPNSCQTIRKWNLKCQDDSETRNYLLVHTQDCPKCKVCIEKNGGCSHMTCNRCKHEFCWVCLNDWKTHGATYDCNRYKGNPEQDNAREALNRYTHYYHRWINHANSLKLEKEFKDKCQSRINEKIMNKGCGTLVDWEFFTEAVDALTRARYTLQFTYPYAYYLENNESKMLFENIQAELEREVENLSHSLEKVNLNDKFNIKTQMNIVEKRRKTLLKDFIQ